MRGSILLTVAALAVMTPLTTPAAIDTDSDGIADNVDNCLGVANADQRDTDADGIGNFCDPDLNGDCSVNFADLQLFQQVFFTPDEDADLNGDGFVNFGDLAIVETMFFASPGPSGGQNACSCTPPAPVPGSPNTEFGGDEVYLLGSLAGNGAAVTGLNNFSDQGDGIYVARIYADSAGSYDYRIGNASATIDYCTDETLSPYDSIDVPVTSCAAAGPLEIPLPGCYEFVLDTQAEVLPPTVELTLVERLGRWDIEVPPGGGSFTAPNGIGLEVPSGAVAAVTTLTVGDLPCSQIDALFASTTLNSHDNRCVGGLTTDPPGIAFAAPVTITAPVSGVIPATERLIAVTSAPGSNDYTLIDTSVTYDAAAGTASTEIEQWQLVSFAGATLTAPTTTRGPTLDPCCSETPTPLDCCCTTYRSTSTMGDATSTDCDCELLANEIVTEFPLCPGMPVFVDRMSHSSEDCPTDFVAVLDTPDQTLWQCEERIVALNLAGTNADGADCSMPVPFDWSVADMSIASVEEIPPGSSARLTGRGNGTTDLIAQSNVGNQFSVTTAFSVVGLDALFLIGESGSQTCLIDGKPFGESETDSIVVPLSVDTACTQLAVETGLSGVTGLDGPLTVTEQPASPLSFVFKANTSPDTLACQTFFLTNGSDSDFGTPLCAGGQGCVAISCIESTTTTGTFGPASAGSGVGGSQWSFNATWSEIVMGVPTIRKASCNGTSTIGFERQ